MAVTERCAFIPIRANNKIRIAKGLLQLVLESGIDYTVDKMAKPLLWQSNLFARVIVENHS